MAIYKELADLIFPNINQTIEDLDVSRLSEIIEKLLAMLD